MRRAFRTAAAGPAAIGCALLLASCGQSGPTKPEAVETEIPEDLQEADPVPAQPAGEAGIGTPMADRVATIGLLNKRNNLSQDLEMSPGESRRVGDIIVRVSACERTAPWELQRETGAFVQVLVRSRTDDDAWNRIFSGWLFKNAPSINVVEHPIYDVWVKDCAMSFPGEGSAPATPAATDAPAAAAAPAPEPAAYPTSDE